MISIPRLRVFAGPNGSGKTTIIQAVKNTTANEKPLNMGTYINADDIVILLSNNNFNFTSYNEKGDAVALADFAKESGLLNTTFTLENFQSAISLKDNNLFLEKADFIDRVAQILARYLRERMLAKKITFSFETVFSHDSNVEIMRRAAEAGYKVYLYFVSTTSPKINKYRAELRVKEGGHPVPEDKIESRYYRSLDLMFEAAQTCYQSYFFDNSVDNQPFRIVAHFKKEGDKKQWDPIEKDQLPGWFIDYYLGKVKGNRDNHS